AAEGANSRWGGYRQVDRGVVEIKDGMDETAPFGSAQQCERKQQHPPCKRFQLDENGQVSVFLRRPIIESAGEPLFCSLVFDLELTLGQVTSTKWIAEVVAQEVGKTCDRVFSPLVTLALFLGQILSDDHSCRAVVARLLAWRAARGLPKCSPDN